MAPTTPTGSRAPGPQLTSGRGGRPERAVRRDDGADDADRLADEQAEVAHGRGGALFEGVRVGQAGVVLPGLGGALGRAGGDGEQRAGLAGPDLSQVAGPLAQPVGDGPHVLGPLAVRQGGPRAVVERVAGGADGAGDVVGLGLGHLEEDLLVGGVDDLDGALGRGLYPLAADEEAVSMLKGSGLWARYGHPRSSRSRNQRCRW